MRRAEWRILTQPAGSTSQPNPIQGLATDLFADLQGQYLLEFEVEDSRGALGRCTTRLSTQTNDDLRIEMVWNVNAANDDSDVDLHLLKSPNGTWFDSGDDGDDCFYVNCKVCDTYDEDECREQIARYNANPDMPPPRSCGHRLSTQMTRAWTSTTWRVQVPRISISTAREMELIDWAFTTTMRPHSVHPRYPFVFSAMGTWPHRLDHLSCSQTLASGKIRRSSGKLRIFSGVRMAVRSCLWAVTTVRGSAAVLTQKMAGALRIAPGVPSVDEWVQICRPPTSVQARFVHVRGYVSCGGPPHRLPPLESVGLPRLKHHETVLCP